MQIGLISDPHANLPALEAVLIDIERVRPDLLVCLGDFVGYGAEPNEVVARLADRCAVSLAGNHDLAALGDIDIATFNHAAAASALWTREQLDESSRVFLESLNPRASFDGMEFAHASFADPVWEYVLSREIAGKSFRSASFATGFIGHTHVPAVWRVVDGETEGGRLSPAPDEAEAYAQIDSARVLINPGGVGQPRDGDPRASWALWNPAERRLAIRRVEYPIELAQEAIRRAGLPLVLADRLAEGW